MRVLVVSVVLVVAALVAATTSRADPITGAWTVEVTGEINSTCTAMLERHGKKVAGTLVCPQANLRIPIQATIGSDGLVRPDGGDLGWVVVPNGESASGTYQSALGAGTWTAVRQGGG